MKMLIGYFHILGHVEDKTVVNEGYKSNWNDQMTLMVMNA